MAKSTDGCDLGAYLICTELLHDDGSSYGESCDFIVTAYCPNTGGGPQGNPGGWDNEEETDVIGGGGSGEDEDDDTVETTPLLDPCHIKDSCLVCDEGYILDEFGNCVEEIIFNEGCEEGYSLNDFGECEQNPIFSADCRSFEYSQPPGESVKACAVVNLYSRFYAYGSQNGTTGVFEVFVRYPIIFFKAPTYMTNGFAANKTARAVTDAIRATEVWFAANPNATKEQVGLQLDLNLTTHMALFGGSWSITPPFNIPSPAPYLASISGSGNCN